MTRRFLTPVQIAGANNASAVRIAGRLTTTGAPTSGTWALGDLVVDSAGRFYLCTGSGTPGTWTSTSSGGAVRPGPGTRYVVPATAPQRELDMADYVMDGTADDVQLQAAYNDVVTAGGGTVVFAGEPVLAAPLVFNGTGEVDDSVTVHFRGLGNYSSQLKPAASVADAIVVSAIARVQITDFGLALTGATNGIRSFAVDDDTYWRSFDESVIARLWITGGYNGHTGTALKLGSAFRSSIHDLHIEGVKYGLELSAEHSDQNPGDLDVRRMMIGVSEANGAAYIIGRPPAR